MQQLKGTGIAIVTPFTPSGEIDFTALANLVEYWIAGKVEYLVVLGTTGESATLTKEEKTQVFNFVVEKVNGRVPVVVGIGGNHTAEVIKALDNFDLSKAAAILSVSPYYNKPNQEGIYLHYKALANATDKPIILYNVPGRTGANVTAETTLRLAKECKNIIAVKEASGNVEQIMQIIANKPENFLVISGDDGITLPLMAAGCDGVISVIANSHPEAFSNMVRACANNEWEKARELHYQLLPIVPLLFKEGSPSGIKYILSKKNLCANIVRLPAAPISSSLEKELDALI